MVREPKIQKDGFAVLLGCDSSVSPSLIGADKCAFSGNVVFRGGFPTTRPGFNQRGLTYPTTEIAEWIEDHVLQGSIVYKPKYGPSLIIASIGGRIFSIDPQNSFTVQEITPTITVAVSAPGFVAPAVGAQVSFEITDPAHITAGFPIVIGGSTYTVIGIATTSPIPPAPVYTLTVQNVNATPGPVLAGTAIISLDVNSYIEPRAWMIQAEIFVIIQDGLALPIIFDGSKCFRSDPSVYQVPTGTVMKYSQGRLWVAVNKNQFVASDLVRGSSGTPTYDRVDGLLYFKENSYIAGGGAFYVPYQSGEITAMESIPILDTSTGNGPMIVFTENGAFSVNAPTDRAVWAALTSPIQTVVMTASGAVSAYATIASTNSDIFFRSPDGYKSFAFAIREFKDSWGTTPISSEMNRVLSKDDDTLIQYSSAIQFDNRMWFTVAPLLLPEKEQGAYFQGLATLDFHPISNMRQKAPPDYDGIHAGIQPTLLFKGIVDDKERAFCWTLNADNRNELWEISKDDPFDNGDGRPKSFVETRSMVFASAMELKKLEAVELYLDDVKGRVDFKVWYKPDQYPCWIWWGRDQATCTNWRDCPTGSVLCTEPITYRPGFTTRLNFGQPLDTDEAADDKPSRFGYEFQLRIEWEGHCRIRKSVTRVSMPDEDPYPVVQ